MGWGHPSLAVGRGIGIGIGIGIGRDILGNFFGIGTPNTGHRHWHRHRHTGKLLWGRDT